MSSSKRQIRVLMCRLSILAVVVQTIAVQAATSNNVADIESSKDDNESVIVVTAPILQTQPGSKTTISAQELQNIGAKDFATIMRYQPLISATGVSSGSSVGKSGFDRAGYTGYNIRGLESNRVDLNVDGISLPNATGRSYVSRAGLNTFGIGRDYIDPYMFGRIDIESGATSVEQPNVAIGGSVSFHNKSADDYLHGGKTTYFGYQSAYDSMDRSWHNGLTTAAGDNTLRGIFVVSRRDGQETRNNSDIQDAYPLNWHSTAFMTSGIWQPNAQHKFTATLDYYHKVNHSRYDSWNSSGSEVSGLAKQQSNTRRWGINVLNEYTPFNGSIDAWNNRIYFQRTQAHDDTVISSTTGSSLEKVYSNYNVNTWGIDSWLIKERGRHDISVGVNAKLIETERPFNQENVSTSYGVIMQPEADSRSYVASGFLQDKIDFNLVNNQFALIPGVRVMYQNTQPQHLGKLSSGSSVLTAADVEQLYGDANKDTQVLPSLILQYELTPTLMGYLQYKRGAQFPNASQLYGSWNIGSSYAGRAQYALVGNPDLETETSNNFELGLKGEATKGISLSGAVFYNDYKNFIAYTRYTRANSPSRFVNVPQNIYTIYQAENRDKAYIWGGEISARINYGTWFERVNGLSTTFAIGYNKGKSKSSYLGDGYVDIDSVAPMKAIIGIAWDDPAKRYGMSMTATFVKGKQTTATNRESYQNTGGVITASSKQYQRVGGYGVVDMSAYWQMAKSVKLSGGIYNLTDRKYRDYLSSRNITSSNAQDASDWELAIMPGRTFQININVDF